MAMTKEIWNALSPEMQKTLLPSIPAEELQALLGLGAPAAPAAPAPYTAPAAAPAPGPAPTGAPATDNECPIPEALRNRTLKDYTSGPPFYPLGIRVKALLQLDQCKHVYSDNGNHYKAIVTALTSDNEAAVKPGYQYAFICKYQHDGSKKAQNMVERNLSEFFGMVAAAKGFASVNDPAFDSAATMQQLHKQSAEVPSLGLVYELTQTTSEARNRDTKELLRLPDGTVKLNTRRQSVPAAAPAVAG